MNDMLITGPEIAKPAAAEGQASDRPTPPTVEQPPARQTGEVEQHAEPGCRLGADGAGRAGRGGAGRGRRPAAAAA